MKKTFLSLCLMCIAAVALAQEKITAYAIHRNGNTNAYIFDNGATMTTGALSETGNCYWLFEPVGSEGGFYIKNARTGRYIQSSVITLSSAVALANAPVEYRKGHDSNGTASTWWLASADNTSFQTDSDGPLGLNFSADLGTVVAYYIKTGRGNSYWEITEHEITITPEPTPDPTPETEVDPVVVTDLSQIDNTKLFTMESKRGQLICSDSQVWGSANASAPSVDNAHKHFALITSDSGNQYLYNLGAQKFVVASRTLSTTPAKWAITADGTDAYKWLFACKSNFINMQTAGGAAGGVVINSWSTPDDGNRMRLTIVAEADMSSLMDAIKTFEEESKKPIVKPALAARLGLVRIPCGTKGAYLTAMSIADYNYTATAAPTSAYVNFATTDFFILERGKTYTLALTAANTTADTDIRAFIDWDGDGIYETKLPYSEGLEIAVPETAAVQDTYLRIRLTDNGLPEMDSDFEGSVYDFRMRIDTPTAISAAKGTATSATGKTFDLAGRRVHQPRHPGLYIIDGKKVVKE
ncbi:MAG: hypothetical protein HUK00_05770 [Bacteroidaceae bacterium]|nr:hypothetical protein [Bacteroidaceae bacterium]